MKNIYITLLLIVTGLTQGLAQITVTNATFPVAGDTLKTATDIFFSDFDPMMEGGDLVWDFTGLQAGNTTITTYKAAADGPDAANFPDANLYQPSSAFQDIYYRVANNRITEVGRAGLDPIFGSVQFDAAVDGNAVFRRAPLSFGDEYDDEYGFALELPVASLPESIAATLSLLASDVRIRVDFQVDDVVDAWGTLSLPETEHDVVRLKRTTLTMVGAEIKLIFGGAWVDLLDLPIPIDEETAALLESTTVTNYIFMSNTDKEEVANVTVDSTGTILSTVFKVEEIVTSTVQTNYSNAEVLAYPNPTYGDVKFEFRNMPSDRYTVDIYDILGKKIWGRTSRMGQQRLDADLSELRRGTYLYRVFDSKGHKLATKRLMIIRP